MMWSMAVTVWCGRVQLVRISPFLLFFSLCASMVEAMHGRKRDEGTEMGRVCGEEASSVAWLFFDGL